METIFGVTPALGGTMTLDGQAVRAAHARATPSARGVYLAPEDRKRHGLVLPMTVAENTSLPNVGSYSALRAGSTARPSSAVAEAEVDAPAHQDAEHPPEAS